MSTNSISDQNKKQLKDDLSKLLASTYALYLKTQGFHWNIVGKNFYDLHKLLEEHYLNLANAADEIAERIRALGFLAPYSFSEYDNLSYIKTHSKDLKEQDMLKELVKDHETLAGQIRAAIAGCESSNDYVSADILTGRLTFHEKSVWMLKAILG